MRRIQRSAIVPYSVGQIFDLINDIQSYPKFMKGCVGAEITEKGDDWLIARLDLSRAGIQQSFVTRNVLNPPHSITLTLHQGPFHALEGEWRFEPLNENASKITFWLEFEFSNKLIGIAAGKLFEKVASDQVDMVCQRAKVVYG